MIVFACVILSEILTINTFDFKFKTGYITKTIYNHNFYDESNHLIHINCMYKVMKTQNSGWAVNFDSEKIVRAILDKYDLRNGVYENSNDQQIGFVYFAVGGYQNPQPSTGPVLKYLMYQPSAWQSCGFAMQEGTWNIGTEKTVYIFGLINV